ncbi:MAG TPA: PAS domain S-box protein [Bacteroidota bacterium]|nr:PAS domain S-box protein [Bacteroidota bacterium]
MNLFSITARLISPPPFQDPEKKRIAGILNTSALAILTGLCTLALYRVFTDRARLLLPLAAMCGVALFSILLVRRGLVSFAGCLLPSALLAFLMYMLVTNDGIHDTGVIAFPGVLVLAGLVMKRRPFLVFTGTALFFIAALGSLEVNGLIRNAYSAATMYTDILDVVVTVGITALTIRLLSDNLLRSLARASHSEKAIRTHADQLRESEQRYRALFEGANDAILIMNGEVFIQCNEMTLATFGCDERAEIVGHTPWEFSPPLQPDGRASREKAIEILEDVSKGTPRRFAWTHRRKDGSLFDADVSLSSVTSGTEVFLQALVRDVSERNRAEERIEEQARLLDVARDAIIVRDMNDTLVYFNRAAQELYGWTLEEARSIPADQLVTDGCRDKFHRGKKAFLEKGEWNGELRQKTKEGKELFIQTHWTLVRDKRGKPSARLIINRDITEKRLLEAQFRRAQRLESLGTLAGGIAHDLNNVLAPITMSLEMLDRKVKDPALKRYIASLESSARRGSDIVKQVLLFARGSEKEFAPQQLRYLIREIASIIHETFPRNIELRSDVAKDLTFVDGDATQLHQVLMNLCVNARDAMPDGGQLTVAASNLRLSETDAKALLGGRPGEYVMLSISDTGTGIAREIQERVFEPFFTTKAPGKGTGLGLSTVYAIVKDHNGFINLYSEPGQGTCFTIYLPAVQHREEAGSAKRTAAAPPGDGEIILLVDDEQAVIEIARELLEVHGYKVLTATNGSDAVSVFRATPRGLIRLVLTDLNMPGMGALAAIEEIRSVDQDIDVVVASGVIQDLNPGNTMDLNIQGYLMKPYTGERMLSMIHEILAKREYSSGRFRS